MKFDELLPILGEAEKGFGDFICLAMGLPRERLKSVKLFDGSHFQEGRTMADLSFVPELTDEENKQFKFVMEALCAMLGARRPYLVEKV